MIPCRLAGGVRVLLALRIGTASWTGPGKLSQVLTLMPPCANRVVLWAACPPGTRGVQRE